VIRRRLLVLTLAGALGACASPPRPRPSAVVGSAPSFGGTDRAWLEITIAMDEQVLPLLDLAPTHGSAAALRTLAAEVTTFHQQELVALRELHALAGLPAENPHKGMPMPGMVTPEQVAAAAAVTGSRFDALLSGHLRAHLEQGIRLAGSAQRSGAEPRTRALATRARTARDGFLKALGNVPG
jgi:Domain of unknown function (DUF305)